MPIFKSESDRNENGVHDYTRQHVISAIYRQKDQSGKFTVILEKLTFTRMLSEFGPETELNIIGLVDDNGTEFTVIRRKSRIYELKRKNGSGLRYALINEQNEVSSTKLTEHLSMEGIARLYNVEAFGNKSFVENYISNKKQKEAQQQALLGKVLNYLR
ncbi:MAG: hypothetical protein QXK65_02190 [Candidatus Micrarchaeaceae archaeon]